MMKKILVNLILLFSLLTTGVTVAQAESYSTIDNSSEITPNWWMNIKTVTVYRDYRSLAEIPTSIYHSEVVYSGGTAYHASGILPLQNVVRLSYSHYRAYYRGSIGGNY